MPQTFSDALQRLLAEHARCPTASVITRFRVLYTQLKRHVRDQGFDGKALSLISQRRRRMSSICGVPAVDRQHEEVLTIEYSLSTSSIHKKTGSFRPHRMLTQTSPSLYILHDTKRAADPTSLIDRSEKRWRVLIRPSNLEPQRAARH